MVFALYASVSAIWICWLVLNVVKARRKNQVRYGDGGIDELMIARSAHSNAIETLPIALILLFGLEYNSGYLWLINLLGSLLIVGRIIHGKGVLSKNLKARILGMQVTIFTIMGLVIANLVFFPYHKLITF